MTLAKAYPEVKIFLKHWPLWMLVMCFLYFLGQISRMRTECTLCESRFENDSKLSLHFKQAHLKMFVCPVCRDYSTIFNLQLQRHLKTNHPRSTEYAAPKSLNENTSTDPELKKEPGNEFHPKPKWKPVTSSNKSNTVVMTPMFKTVFNSKPAIEYKDSDDEVTVLKNFFSSY